MGLEIEMVTGLLLFFLVLIIVSVGDVYKAYKVDCDTNSSIFDHIISNIFIAAPVVVLGFIIIAIVGVVL